MKDYFKRLKDHPGLGFATLFTILGTLAGASNTGFSHWYYGALFGGVLMGGLIWSIVLLSNVK